VILSAPGGNVTLACSVIMINATSGTIGPPFTGGVQQVTIAPFAANASWVSVALAPAQYLGVVPGGGTQGVLPGGFGPIPGVPPFPAGPATVGGGLQAIQICANPSSLPAVPGTYFTSVAFNGAGVSNVVPSCVVGNQLGQTCVNVEFLVSGGGVAPTKAIFGEIGITRNTPAGAPTFSNLLWVLDANGNNAFDPAVCTGPPQNSCTGDKFKFFGLNGDTPVTGDWDGTGVIRMAIFRCTLPSATVPAPGFCQFFIDLNNSGTFDGTFGGDAILTFGLPGDVPVVGDWNGSGTTKIGVFRNSASAASGAACPAPSAAGTLQPMCWIVDVGPGVAGLPPSVALTSGANAFDPTGLYTKTYYYGNPGDKPVVSNWSGASTPNGPVDGVGVFTCPTAGSNCTWTVSSSGTNMPIAGDAKFTFGVGGTDQPIVGNWGANPLTKKRIGVLRTASVTVPCPAITTGPQTGTVSNSCWIVDTNGSGVLDLTDQVYQFGAPGDVPVVGFWTMP